MQRVIICLVTRIIIIRILRSHWIRQFTHWVILEIFWTIIPIGVLIILALPSLKNLYISEFFLTNNKLNLKILGHQWYWEYRLTELSFNKDCYPLNKADLYRIGEADLLRLPFNCSVRSLISSQDVIHSWSLPSIGFKVDACPGRLNYFVFFSHCNGVIIGQCSELCGAYHSWIPIYVETTRINIFLNWLKTQLC